MLQEGGADGTKAVPLLRAAGCWLVPGGQHPSALPGRGGAQLHHLCSCLSL